MSETLEPALPDHLDEQAERLRGVIRVQSLKAMLEMLEQALEEE